MAKIVLGMGAPHSPNLPSVVAKNPAFVEAGLYADLRRELEASRADVLLIFANDHFNTFFLNNFPLFAVGAAPSTAGPNDFTPMPRYEIPVAEQLAAHIHATGISNGFDQTLCQEFEVDHAFAVPVHFLAPHVKLPILPIFVNCFSSPLPLAERAHAFGRMIGGAIRSHKEDLRVAILASGSFSLEIGGPQIPPNERSGVPDRAWVERIVECMKNHRVADLIMEATPLQMARAGNAGGELLNWIAMLGVIGDKVPTSILPQPHGHAFGLWRWE
jgi:aromatic ring-opening dioxygenase catalytic subunit (LigB family)